jgi:cellulose biosynthesis protein BcsQ
VGNTTLAYPLAYALAELGYKTLLVDLDPQSNLTLFALTPEELHEVWKVEDAFIADFVQARTRMSPDQFDRIAADVRSIHFLLKPTEDGTDNPSYLSKPLPLHENLGLIPGRLSIHTFEDTIASRWRAVYGADLLAIRTITRVRSLCIEYAEKYSYDFALIDTSPNLGTLNKAIMTTVDGFIIPCMPDMFSLYGIQQIGKALKDWEYDFGTIFMLLSERKFSYFPQSFASFLGFTLINAGGCEDSNNPWNLSKAQYNYGEQISATIREHLLPDLWQHLSEDQLANPIGGISIMDLFGMRHITQKYKTPIWKVPGCNTLDTNDQEAISANRHRYEETQQGFHVLAKDLLTRLQQLETKSND